MDGGRFDAWTRLLARGSTRRRFGRLAGGFVAALVSAGGPPTPVAAACFGRPCGAPGDCCPGTVCGAASTCCRAAGGACKKSGHCCRPTDPCKRAVCTKKRRCKTTNAANGTACRGGGTCQQGICRGGTCANGTKECPNHPGECRQCCADTDCCPPDNARCQSRQTPPRWMGCSNAGACSCDMYAPEDRLTCGSATGPCQQCCTNDDCVARFSDPNRVCTVTAGNASCTCPASHPTLCYDSTSASNLCTDTSSHNRHCGGCFIPCNPPFTTCVNGQCQHS